MPNTSHHLSRSLNFGSTGNSSLHTIKHTSKDELLQSLLHSSTQVEALIKQMNLEKSMRQRKQRNMSYNVQEFARDEPIIHSQTNMAIDASEDSKVLIDEGSSLRNHPQQTQLRTSNPNFQTAKSLLMQNDLSYTSTAKRDLYVQGLMKTYNASPVNSGPVSMVSVQNLHSGNPASKGKLS